MLITILTATYNRAYTLPKLYKSLKNQNAMNFEWVVVDDGSTDNTKDVIDGFIEKSPFPIRYFYKDNGGKHTAVNLAMKNIKSELCFDVDSDDWLTNDATEQIEFFHNKYSGFKHDRKICGFVFLQQYENGDISGSLFPKDEAVGTFWVMRKKLKTQGEKRYVLYTELIKSFTYPEVYAEKFFPCSAVEMYLNAMGYAVVCINKAIYRGDYLEDGLSKAGRQYRLSSSSNLVLFNKMKLDSPCSFKRKIKAGMLYNIYSFNSKAPENKLSKRFVRFIIITATALPSWFIYRYWKHRYKTVQTQRNPNNNR